MAVYDVEDVHAENLIYYTKVRRQLRFSPFYLHM